MRRSLPLSFVLLPALSGFAPLDTLAPPPPCAVTHTLWRGGELLGNIHTPITLEPPVPPNMGVFVPTQAFDDIRELTQYELMGGGIMERALIFPSMRRQDGPRTPGPIALEPVNPDDLVPADRVLRLNDEASRTFVGTMQLSVERVQAPHPQILAACPWLRASQSFWLVHWSPAR